jgi:imidazolonepropionase-like amidohydrolase
MLLLADTFFDGRRFRREPVTIRVEGESIAAVEPRDHDAAPPAGALDLRGTTLLPGLVNTHAHIVRKGTFAADELLSIGQVVRNLEGTLASGVTTIGEMGSGPDAILPIRARTRADALAGPDIRCAGPLVTCPGGYPDWLPAIIARAGVLYTCGTEDEARRNAQRVAASGMDHVKVCMMARNYSDQPLATWKEPVARALCDEAHRLGLRVFAHAHRNPDYELALAAGVDGLAHSTFDPLEPDLLARVRDAGVSVCPTLWVFESACLVDELALDRDDRYARSVGRDVVRSWARYREAYAASGDVVPDDAIGGGLPKERGKEAVRNAAANLLLLADAGVPIAFGNDAAFGYSIHARPGDELLAMHRAGLDARTCLEAATSGAAAHLGLADRGLLEAGKRADLLAVEGDLERDLAAIERVHTVVARGHVVASAPLRGARTAAAVVRGVLGTVAAAVRGLR